MELGFSWNVCVNIAGLYVYVFLHTHTQHMHVGVCACMHITEDYCSLKPVFIEGLGRREEHGVTQGECCLLMQVRAAPTNFSHGH